MKNNMASILSSTLCMCLLLPLSTSSSLIDEDMSSGIMTSSNTAAGTGSGISTGTGTGRYSIEGRVYPPEYITDPGEIAEWLSSVKILLNGGEAVSFVRGDGWFSIWGASGGSHVVQPIHPEYAIEGVRVEINSKGKFRARRLNYVQSSLVIQVPYPLRVKPVGKFKYFQLREQWRITDFLFNPMILMMVLPFLIIMILPKMMNDPETKKEMEQLSNLTKMREMPEMSEMIASIFGKTPPPKPQASGTSGKSSKAAKKRQ